MGIHIQFNLDSHIRPNAIVRSSLVEENHDGGVTVVGADALLEGLVVRGTLPRPATGISGAGVALQFGPDPDVLTSGRVRSSLVEQNTGVGVVAHGASVSVEGSVVRDTQPDTDGLGFGVYVCRSVGMPTDSIGEPPHATLRGVLVEQTYAGGVMFCGMTATVDRTVVRDTLASPATGPGEHLPGDGLVVQGKPELPTQIELSRTLVQRSARAGVANFGAAAALWHNTLDCNTIHLNGEQDYAIVGTPVSLAFSFEDQGGNRCGCGAQLETCQVLSSGLAAPEPIEPIE